MQTTSSCPGKYSLTEKGLPILNNSDTADYCKPNGSADYTRAVLECVSLVKRDYKFQNGATVEEIKDEINVGCNSST